MVLTIISLWFCAIAIGINGARAALANRWVNALATNVLAGIYSIVLLSSLKGEFAISLLRAGDLFLWLAMLSPLVMWAMLGIGQTLAVLRQRKRPSAA
jgi:hypothetical protein